MLRQLKELFGQKKTNKEPLHRQSTSKASLIAIPPVPPTPKAPRDEFRSHSGPRLYTNHTELSEAALLEDLITTNLRLADRLADQGTNAIHPESRLGSYSHLTFLNDPSLDSLVQTNNNDDSTAPASSSTDIRTQHVDSVVEDNLFASPTSTSQTTARHDLLTSTAMASSSVIQPPGYRPASPSLLEGFDDLDTLPTSRPAPNLQQTVVPPALANMATQTATRFRYQLDPSILGDFDEEMAGTSTQSTPQIAPVTQNQNVHLTSTRPVTQRGYGPVAASILGGFDDEQSYGQNRPSSSRQPSQQERQPQQSQPRNANNPYVKIIEARQNAMTMAYLRNNPAESGVHLPAFPTDDIG